MEAKHWYQQAVFYEVAVRAFYDGKGDGHGDLIGLTEKLDYLKELGVDCLWLLPIYASPLKDDGYDIADFCTINPDYGSLDDFKKFVKAAYSRKIRVVMDLVMNHTSDQHPWFKAARLDRNSKYHDYYVWRETDKKYQDARIIFIDTEKSNWTWNESTKEFYWHRFYSCQPDLNYDNPVVIEEMFKVIQFWLDLGIDGFRVDAVPYLVEREGTSCENLPETHAILRKLRHFVDEHYSDKVLICEANQWPKDVRKYLGDGDEFHMAFNFPIMPRIFLALRQGNSAPIKWALEQLPDIPENCQWGVFLRNHDELTLEMVSKEERRFMWQEFAPDMRYRLNLGIRRRLAPLLDNDRRKIELVYSLLLSLPGSPFIYYGDEIGMGDNVELFDRNGLRTPMQWQEGKNAGFSKAAITYSPTINDPTYQAKCVNVNDQMVDPGSLWHTLKKMIGYKKDNPVLFSHSLDWMDCEFPSVAAFERKSSDARIYAVHNLSNEVIQTHISVLDIDSDMLTDIFSGQQYPVQDSVLKVELYPYQYLWLKLPAT